MPYKSFSKYASLQLGMSSVVLRKHKKKSKKMSDPYQQNAPITTVQQHQLPAQHVGSVPPPPPPKRANSAYERPRQSGERDDGERRALGERQESQNLPRTLRTDRNDYRDEYPRTKSSGLSKFASHVKSFLEGPEYEDERDYQQHYAPGHYFDERGHRPSKDALIRDIDRLMEANYKLGQNNKKLVEQLDQAQRSVNKSAATNDSIQRTMDNKEHFLGDQALDAEIKSNFLRLMANIRTWTKELELSKSDVPDMSQLDEQTKNQLDLIVPGCLSKGAEYWTDGRKMRMLFRGWLGYIVSQEILRVRTGDVNDNSNGTDFWLPQQTRSAVVIVEDILSNPSNNLPLKAFNNWRALSFELLSRVVFTPPQGEQQGEQDQFASRVIQVLRPFIPSGNEILMRDQLMQTIFIEASKFSRLLRKQRPAWLVADIEQMCPPKVGSMRNRPKFLPEFMQDDDLDDDEDTSKLAVKMFISPALIKRGNSEGEDYTSRDCIVKALVVTV